MAHNGTVYLLHFERSYRHARHYIGFTQNLEQRNGECFAESRAPSGLGGEMVVLGGSPTQPRAPEFLTPLRSLRPEVVQS